jgi:acetyl esterase
MSVLAHPALAAFAARVLQRGAALSPGAGARDRLPEFPGRTRQLVIPTSVAPAPATLYLPDPDVTRPPVHVNFHGGGYVMALTQSDDPVCRFLAAEAGAAVLNVDYAVAPQHRFPAPPYQAYEVVRWVAEQGAAYGWDGGRLTVGGQSAGGGLAAAAARQALEQGGPAIALQVLHYPPLDLATPAREKRAAIPKARLRPWMADIFDNTYVPDPRDRTDRLVSPAHPSDTADLTGIAPALVLTAAHDLLREECARYAERLRKAGALVEHVDVPDVDHGYDLDDDVKARESYALIARHLRQATAPAA